MTFPSSSSSDSDATLFVALGVGLLAAVGVGWAWTRARRPSGSDRVSAASRLPSAGLLGAGTPSLSDGLSVWAAPEGTLEGLAATALALLSERHRVLVVAPSEVTLAPVGGGPVYRLGALRPSHVGDAADGLHAEGGAPLAVLLVGVAHDGAALREYADLLPGEVGAVALIEGDAQDLGFPLVRLTGEGGVWRAVSGARSARLTRGRLGVRVEPDSSAA
jgi:hypothetical protein